MKNFTPNMVIIVIVLLLICSSVAIYFNRQNTVPVPENSQSPTLAAKTEYSASNSATPIPSTSLLTDYIFPESKVVKQTSTKLNLESNSDSGSITQWYKDKIRQSGFSAKSFSQTNTNGVVFNKLSAAKPGEKIEITIKKDQNASNVTITVDRS